MKPSSWNGGFDGVADRQSIAHPRQGRSSCRRTSTTNGPKAAGTSALDVLAEPASQSSNGNGSEPGWLIGYASGLTIGKHRAAFARSQHRAVASRWPAIGTVK
jgi:hypothetical protein